jgi:hypothetical protein
MSSNRKLVPAATLAALCLVTTALAAVEERNSWSETFAVQDQAPTLVIENIWGDVVVRPGQGGRIVVNITEHRSAPDSATFAQSQELLRLETEASEAGVSLRVNTPEWRRGRDRDCRHCRVEYRFEVEVPVDTRLDISTVNDGRVDIAGVQGPVTAANVNGPVSVSGLTDCARVNSVNGEITLRYQGKPGHACEIETVNGDISLSVPAGTGLDVAMDLFNGRLLTTLPVDALGLPATVQHSESGGRHQYRIEQLSGVRIGAGGPTYRIATLNGDVRIQNTD